MCTLDYGKRDEEVANKELTSYCHNWNYIVHDKGAGREEKGIGLFRQGHEVSVQTHVLYVQQHVLYGQDGFKGRYGWGFHRIPRYNSWRNKKGLKNLHRRPPA